MWTLSRTARLKSILETVPAVVRKKLEPHVGEGDQNSCSAVHVRDNWQSIDSRDNSRLHILVNGRVRWPLVEWTTDGCGKVT